MLALSASLLAHLQPGVSYAPGTFSRKVFGCSAEQRARQCGIFLNVVEGLGMFKRVRAGLSVSGTQRKRDLFVYTGDLSKAYPVCSADWLEFAEYKTQQTQKLTQVVMHYLGTRGTCTWTKVVEDINGRYDGCFRPRRVYDVVNVLKVVLSKIK